MKIQESLGNRPKIIGINQSEDRKSMETKDLGFQGQLHQAEYGNYKGRLDQLACQIFEQGKKIEKRMDIKELIVYKKLVSEFLNEFLGNSHKFSKQSILDRRGRYRVYSIIKKINRQLDSLAEDVLDNQKGNLKVLQRLDDIKGLILDLLM
ncbi:MAG: YaaR family protein [Firmicutes bacterium]|nr:YaaR family protein [Bacillota bacterium]